MNALSIPNVDDVEELLESSSVPEYLRILEENDAKSTAKVLKKILVDGKESQARLLAIVRQWYSDDLPLTDEDSVAMANEYRLVIRCGEHDIRWSQTAHRVFGLLFSEDTN